MQMEDGKNAEKRPLTNREIAEEYFLEIERYTRTSLREENNRLIEELNLIGDLLENSGLDKWSSLWSLKNTLTDGIEIDKLINEVPPSSKFYKKVVAVNKLLECLNYWIQDGVLSDQKHSIRQAYEILRDRMRENTFLIHSRT